MKIAIALLLAATVTAEHVLHEKRSTLPNGWFRHSKPDPSQQVPLRIGLKQSNLDKLEELIYSVSDPRRPTYGQHYSSQEVADFFAPSKEAINSVKDWLVESGFDRSRLSLSAGRNWINVQANVAEVEQLLQAEYHRYHNNAKGQFHLATEAYFVPQQIQRHIDLILPTVEFDVSNREMSRQTIWSPREERKIKRDMQPNVRPGGNIAESMQAINQTDLSLCWNLTTPACLQALYKFKATSDNLNEKSTIGVVQLNPLSSLLYADLKLFMERYVPGSTDFYPELVAIDTGGQPLNNTYGSPALNFALHGEANLDFEYTTSLLYPHKITYFSEGRNDSLATNGAWNILLDAFDKSYCTYDGGNDFENVFGLPLDDPKFNLSQCGAFEPTHIFSISYGGDEVLLPDPYMQRQCAEFGKFAAQGHTFFFSSGDYGVAGPLGCLNETIGTAFTNGTSYVQGPGLFVPSFPSTCPWITSVGATQLPTNASVTDREVAAYFNLGNKTDPDYFASGGGFSNVFGVPQYQAEAVATYLNNTKLPTSKFNTSSSRGYPDLSANGVQFSLALGGNFTLVFGTSASTPVVSSIFTLINGARLNAGKSPIGFVNPVIYQNKDAFNDIVYGNNAGCGSSGFPAKEGWDAVTGLGTPDYEKLVKVFMDLQ